MTTRRPPPTELVRAQAAIERHALAPDGTWLAYVRRTVVGPGYRRHLWRVGTREGRSRRLTNGAVSDTAPAISPDGRQIAFLRTSANPLEPASERRAEAWVLRVEETKPRVLARLPHGVEAVAWSPDSRRIALLGPSPEPRFLVGERVLPEGRREGSSPKAVTQASPTARRITRMDFRDDSGYRDRRTHLWLVSLGAAAGPRRLTRGDFDVGDVAWSPDGRTIAFTADLTPDAALNPQTAIYAVPARGGPMREVARLRGDLSAPAWSPDGRWLAAFGTDVADPPEATQPEVWLIDAASGEVRSLTATLDLPAGRWASSHLSRSEEPEGPVWLDDSSLAALVTRRGRSTPWRIGLQGRAEPLVDDEACVLVSGLRTAGHELVVNAQVDGTANELYAVRGGLRRLTSNGAAWQRRFDNPRLDELEVPGPAGTIQVWLYSPASTRDDARGPTGRLPTIIDIHGGPTGSWGPGTSLDLIALTGAGYRVARPNLRGSAGFGAAWVDGLGSRWGEVDAADALAVVDALVARGLADERRIGVLGLSYGGFLVNWLLGVTDRFAAAVSENGVTNQVTAWAECHFGIYDTRRTGLGDPLSETGMLGLWSRSPLRNASRIRTPLLILQAEEDRVCPASDNVQLFAALRALGREVEYVLYPEEHHVMQMNGRPDRRADRLERILAWFDGHLDSPRRQPPRRAGRVVRARTR